MSWSKQIPDDWRFIITDELENIMEKLKGVETTPKQSEIFSFTACRFDDIKIVIIGQDPYPDVKHAHGLAFSSRVGIPPSLRNIYKALLHSKLISKMPRIGDLTNWSKQGILLLNRALTTVPGKPKQHEFWHEYTAWLVRKISKKKRDLIYMLWGNDAKSLKPFIKYGTKLEWSHPSPMARASFETCDHFTQASERFQSRIEWDPEIEPGSSNSRQESSLKVKEKNSKISGSETTETDPDMKIKTKNNKPDIRFEQDEIMSKVKLELQIQKTKADYDRTGFLVRFSIDLDPECEHEIPDICRIYTDGSCYPNNRSKDSKGGVCCYSPDADIIVFGQLLPGNPPTNQRAEGIAIYEAFKVIRSLKDVEEFIIVTDSKFWIDMFGIYMPKWEATGIDFNTKANPDITKKIYKLYKKISDRFRFEHINSHTGKSSVDHINNDIADRVCGHMRMMETII